MDYKKTAVTLMLFAMVIWGVHGAFANNMYPTQQEINQLIKNDFSEYMENIQKKLRANWQPPDFMEEGHVRVHFKLDRQGHVINAAVVESSGNDLYDESALEAIRECAPFGDFPENSLKEFISIKYSFDTILIEEERMNGYYELAKLNTSADPLKALEYLNMALARVGGEEASCFLYKRRAEIKERLGDIAGAKEDYDTYNLYTKRTNIKRVHLLRHMVETKSNAYMYHYLAYAYEQVGDYNNAIAALDMAINMTDENGVLKRYRNSLLQKQHSS